MTETTYVGTGIPKVSRFVQHGDEFFDMDNEIYYHYDGNNQKWVYDENKTKREYIRKNFSIVDQLKRQQKFSGETFGPREGANRLYGLMDHIQKELQEILDDPTDLEEWIDLIMLATDGAWRFTGCEAEDICEMLEYKQKKNESRNWPDWRDAEPGKAIEHIKG